MKFILSPDDSALRNINLSRHRLSGSVHQPGTSREALHYELQSHEAGDFEIKTDKVHDYTKDLNSSGFRGPEFGPADLIALGCSQTYGIGVCSNNVWPKFLSEKLGLSYVNLSYVAWSIPRMVREFFAYVNKYGAPKAVALLLPEMSRYMFVTRGTVLTYEQDNNIDNSDFMDFHLRKSNRVWDESQLPKISKRPHFLDDIMPLDYVYFQNLNALYSLLTFCQHMNIAVAVSSWDWSVVDLLRALKTINPEILGDCKYYKGEALCSEDHEELLSSLDLQHDEFNWGTDKVPGGDNGHMGVHQHYHYSEVFYEILEKQLDL